MRSKGKEIRGHRATKVVWGQFGIRDLLITMTISAVLVQALKQHQRRVQIEQETAAILREAGGSIVFDTEQDWRNPQFKGSVSGQFQEFVGKQHFQSIVVVDLCGVQMTPERLELVTRLKRLRSLDLVGPETTDETLEQLSRLTTLRELTLTDTRVTWKGVERLKSEMPQLAVSCCFERECGK
jgi:hypothetical protein